MNEEQINRLVSEIRKEQQVSPSLPDTNFVSYVKQGEFDINEIAGCKINYEKDLKARELLKNYVLYANHKRLAEFKELYLAEYVTLQLRYNRDTNVS